MASNDNDNGKTRKTYVTKQEKAAFIQWYLNKYGYNVNLKVNNSRVLSETYHRECGILIPKITIYRWLGKLDQKIVKKFSEAYISDDIYNNDAEGNSEGNSEDENKDDAEDEDKNNGKDGPALMFDKDDTIF